MSDDADKAVQHQLINPVCINTRYNLILSFLYNYIANKYCKHEISDYISFKLIKLDLQCANPINLSPPIAIANGCPLPPGAGSFLKMHLKPLQRCTNIFLNILNTRTTMLHPSSRSFNVT